jgi:hypothetical protein
MTTYNCIGVQATNTNLVEESLRFKSGHDHFTKLLGQPSSVQNQDLEVPVIHPSQEISVDLFSKD